MATETPDQKTRDELVATLPPVTSDMSVDQAVATWTLQATAADTIPKIQAIGQSMEDFGRPIKFKLGLAKFNMWVGCLSGGFLLFSAFRDPFYWEIMASLAQAININKNLAGWGFPVLLLSIAVIFEIVVRRKENRINHLADGLVDRVAAIQYELKPGNADAIEQSIRTFGEFRRGNHSRSIHDCYKGTHRGKHWSFVYQAYRLHYVDKEERSVINARNFSDTETDYKHYDRSGIILNFPWVKQIHICKSYETTLYGTPFTPASTAFNERFYCRGADDMTLARFLTPKMVERLTFAASEIPSLCIEVNADGRLILGCSDHHVVDFPPATKGDRYHDPRITPKGFNALLRSDFHMKRLDKLLQLADDLGAPYTR